jgi:hypothetical protein
MEEGSLDYDGRLVGLQVMGARVQITREQLLWPDLLEGSSKLDKYHYVTLRRGCARRDLAHATNNRDNHPSTYRRSQPTQSRRIDVKAQTGWTAVRRSTTPSGIERISLQASQDSRWKNSKSLYFWIDSQKDPLVLYSLDTYSTSGVFSLDKINGNMQREVVALLLLIAWPNGTLWMVDILLHACPCVDSNLVADCLLNSQIYLTSRLCMVAEWSVLLPLFSQARPSTKASAIQNVGQNIIFLDII